MDNALKKNGRNVSLDALRIISMIMIVTLHYLGKGGLIKVENNNTFYYFLYNLLKSMSIIAVNCYVLISGYFLINSEFKWKKIFKLWGETIFYSISIYLIIVILGYKDIEIKGLIKSFFPILTKEYWFVNTYLLMYILSPFLNKLIFSLNKEDYKKLIIILVVGFSILSLLPSSYTFDTTNGYSITWFVCLYIFAGYIKLHLTKNVKTSIYLNVYLFTSLFITIAGIIIDILCNHLGIASQKEKLLQYNSIFVLIESVALFMFFKQLQISNSKLRKIIPTIAPLTFAVYLIHEQIELREILYKQILHTEICYNNHYSILIFVGSVLTIFIICSLIEFVRQKLIKYSKILYIKIS